MGRKPLHILQQRAIFNKICKTKRVKNSSFRRDTN